MTTAAREQAAPDAEGASLGARLGMGDYLSGHAGSSLRARVVIGKVLLFMLAPGLAVAVLVGIAPGTAILAVIMVTALLMATIPPRATWGRLFVYRDGIIAVSSRDEARPAVMRDADLATLQLNIVEGYDGTHMESCVLGDRAGNVLTIRSRLHGPSVCELAASHAERVLAERLAGPLTDRIDAGLPVTFGDVTVDRAGISVLTWAASWQEVQKVSTRLHGHRLSVSTGVRGRGKDARLMGAPNDFLARYVIEHAAGGAGVSVSAE
jgi:hypothetical protein